MSENVRKVKLGDVVSLITKGTTPTSIGYDFTDSGINFIKIESISDEGEFIESKFAYISEKCNNKLKRSQLVANDILFSIAGAIGRVAKVTENILPANMNQALALIRIKPGIVDYDFLCYLLQSRVITEQFEKKKQGVAQLNISLADIGNFEIPLIEYDQQLNIVKKLDRVTDIINKRKHQLEKLDELIKSQFIEMFGDLRKNPKGWCFIPLGKVCDVRDGTHDSPKYCSEGYPLLTSKNFTDGEVDFTGANFISEKDFVAINQRSKVDVGDIVMPMIGTIGHPVIINTSRPFAIKNVALIKFAKSEFLNVFIREILKSDYFLAIISSKNRGNTQKFIALGDIRAIEIPQVPYEMQERFAHFVEQTDKSKFTIKQSLAQLEVLKKSLMQKYFG